jgi:hypothetical protein
MHFNKPMEKFLTTAHKPELQDEKVRIYNKRGEIRESPSDGLHKIYIRARMYPALKISRTIGDLIAH